jgi:DNA-binding response OmpR family regulator
VRILLAEDDELLGSGIKAGLAQHGFAVDWVRDGIAAERELVSGAHEAMVLDLGLPRQDGLACLRAARARRNTTPVLVLTARDAVASRIEGLDAGADDYLVKPVDLGELAARLRALVRRAHGQPQSRLIAGGVEVDPAARRAWCKGQPVELTVREFDLLHVFMLNVERVLTREQLEQHLYQWGTEVSSNTIEVHVSQLRRKLHPQVVETLRGVGYVMRRDPAA